MPNPYLSGIVIAKSKKLIPSAIANILSLPMGVDTFISSVKDANIVVS